MTWGKPMGFLERGQDVNNLIQRLDARLDVISPVCQTAFSNLDLILHIRLFDSSTRERMLISQLFIIPAISNALARLGLYQKPPRQPLPRPHKRLCHFGRQTHPRSSKTTRFIIIIIIFTIFILLLAYHRDQTHHHHPAAAAAALYRPLPHCTANPPCHRRRAHSNHLRNDKHHGRL